MSDNYDDLLTAPAINPAHANLYAAAGQQPEQVAEYQALGKRYGVPTAIVSADPTAWKSKAQQEDRLKAADSPAMQAWLGQHPDNAALASDTDLRVMGFMERKIRSVAEGFGGQFVGSGLVGIGHSIDAIGRGTVRLGAKLGLEDFVNAENTQNIDKAVTPYGDMLRAIGQPAKDYWKSVGVPAQHQDFGDQVVAGLGQVIGQLPLVASPIGWAIMFGQGADQVADKIAKDDAPQWKKDLAMLGGGAVTAVTEKFALDHWAKLGPLTSLKNPLLARAGGVGLASASEGGQEFSENVLHDLLRQQLTNPNAAIDFGDAAQAGGVGGTVGGIVRTAIESALHIKSRQHQQFFKDLGDATKESEIGQRAPDKLVEFITHAAQGGPVENVFIPAEQFTRYFQSVDADPAEAAKLAGVTNYDEAVAAGTDLIIPLGDFTAKIAGTDHLQGLMPDLRLHQGDLTAREVQEMAANKESREAYYQQQLDSLIAENEAANGVNTAIDRVTTDVEGQLISSGVEASTAKTQAKLMRGVAVLAQRAFPDMNPVAAAEKLWSQYGLTVNRELPPILANLKNADVQLDPLLERLRAGSIPSDQEAFGQPLHEFIRSQGGVQDQGGELSAQDADTDNAPFVKNLIQSLGMDFDGAREAAQQAGYPVGETEADFIGALIDSLKGNPVYSPNQENAQALDIQQTLASLDKALKDSGIDLNAVDNATARKMLERQGEVQGARFEQGFDTAQSKRDALFGMDPVMAEFGPASDSDFKAAKKAAQEKYAELQKLTVEQGFGVVTKDGREVKFSGAGFKEAAQHAADRRVLSILAGLDNLFQSAIPIYSEEVNGKQQAKAFHYYAVKADFGSLGEAYVLLEVIERQNGEFFYDADATSPNEIVAEFPVSLATRTKSEAGDEVSASKGRLARWISEVNNGTVLYQSAYRGTLAEVRQQWADAGIKNAITEKDGVITLSQIVVPDGERGSGMGTEAMQALIDYADRTGQHVALSPSADFGGNKKRLVEFYKRFGFVENKGKNRAFTTSESMYRQASGKILYQSQDKKRGYLQIGQNRQMQIGLTENANLSTFLHETGHFYLEVLGDLAATEGAAQQVKDDYAAILKWLGVADRGQIETKHHEMFARGNEAYLMEGNAPAPELQGAFQRFKSWLAHIYGELSKLDVKLSEEVRGVFDRIYATDQEIEQAKDAVDVAPLFLDAATMGMSEAEFALYKVFVGKVSAEAQDKLTAKLMKEYKRGFEAWWKEARVEMLEEVSAEVDAQPVYQAFAALAAGDFNGQPFKLDKADLVRRYGETYLKNLPRGFQRVYSAESGIDLDTAAEMVGFHSGDDLVKALVEMRPRKPLIEAETDKRMAEKYGDKMLDGTLADDAKAALHNEERANVLAIELRALKRKAKEVAPFVRQAVGEAKAEAQAQAQAKIGAAEAETKFAKADAKAAQSARIAATETPSLAVFRNAARGRIEQMQVRDIQPNSYLIAGRRAAKEAFTALARNDYQTAAAAKQRELLNHYLYLEAVKAKAEADSVRKYAKTFESSKKRERMGKAGADYLGQIDALLARYELAKVTVNALNRRESLQQFIEARQAEGEAVMIDQALIDEAGITNWQQVSMGELRAFRDALKNLEHLANFKNKLLRKRKAIDFALVKDELLAAIEGNIEGSTDELDKLNDKGEGIKEWVVKNARKFDAGLIKVEQLIEWLDGGKIDGPWARYVFDLADDAQTREYDLHGAVTTRLYDLAEAMPAEWKHSLYDKTDVRLPGIGRVLTRYDLLSIAMNTGNQSNYDKLLKGRGWTDAQVQGALSRLSDADMTYVQGVWDALESLWPEIAALQKRVSGVEPEKIPPRAIITAGGAEFAGGYFPMSYDPLLSAAGEKQADAAESVQDFMARGYGLANTDRGHTKGRLEDFAAPVRLDYEQVLTSHLSKVIKDISHREAILSLNKILKNPQIKAAIIDKLGNDKYMLLTTWEQSLVSDRADTLHQPLQWYNAIFRGLRTNTAIVTMGWKISTAMSQVAGFGPSLDTVKGKYLTSALRDYGRHPVETAARVAEKSGEMRHRMQTIERDAKEALLKTRGESGMLVSVQRSAFYLTAMMDRAVSVPTWMGGYRQALAEGHTEEDAIRAGDRAVRLSQGAGGAKDLAAVQRNSELMKLLTMYYTPFSVLYARLRDMGHSYHGPKDLPMLAARSIALVILPAVLGELLAGRGPDDDEDKTMWAMRKALLYPFASMPVIRDIASWKLEPALAGLSGGDLHFQPGYKFTPIVSAAEKLGNLPGRVLDGMTGERPWDDVAWDALETSGYLFGLPTAQPRITGEYLWDLFNGDAHPDNAAQAMHDVLFRRPAERR